MARLDDAQRPRPTTREYLEATFGQPSNRLSDCHAVLDDHRFHDVETAVQFLAPFPERKGFAVPGRTQRRSLIARLLQSRRPAAIAWLVVAVVVDALNSVFGGGSRPHVGKEVLKGLPAFTDRNATTAVIRKGLVVRVSTTAEHMIPASVLSGLAHSMTRGVVAAFDCLPVKTSTASRLPSFQEDCRHEGHGAAITETFPYAGLIGVRPNIALGKQASKSLSGDIKTNGAHGCLSDLLEVA